MCHRVDPPSPDRSVVGRAEPRGLLCWQKGSTREVYRRADTDNLNQDCQSNSSEAGLQSVSSKGTLLRWERVATKPRGKGGLKQGWRNCCHSMTFPAASSPHPVPVSQKEIGCDYPTLKICSQADESVPW